jgi:hypothetical protein
LQRKFYKSAITAPIPNLEKKKSKGTPENAEFYAYFKIIDAGF